METLINRWHTKLNMPKYDFTWHSQDVAEELEEYREAKGLLNKWSELSDVVYTVTRAQWSGHKEIKFPLSKLGFYVGSLYMFPKYNLRWKFFRVLGKRFGNSLNITEVRNPERVKKLEDIAIKYNVDPERFKTEAVKLMKRWILLK